MPSRVVLIMFPVRKPVGEPAKLVVELTPGVVETRSITLRLIKGRSRTLYSGSTEPTHADVVAISVSAATLTSTVCATEPTRSMKFSRTCCEMPRVTLL